MFRALSQRFKTISSANSVSFSSENKTHVHGRKERERETTGISYRDMNVCMWIWYPVSLISYDVNSIKYLESTIVVYAYLFILCVHTCTYIYIYMCVLDWTYWNRAPLFSHCFKAAGLISQNIQIGYNNWHLHALNWVEHFLWMHKGCSTHAWCNPICNVQG